MEILKELYNIDENLISMAQKAEEECAPIFEKYDKMCLVNSAKILKAFQENYVSTTDFFEETGYGYSDKGRDKLEKIYAQIFKAEDALVRPQIMSGTHAISLTFGGLLHSGDTLLYITGLPYDSVQSIVGLVGESKNSLLNNGIKYKQIDLVDNDFDYDKIAQTLKTEKITLVTIQRSRGYSSRDSLSIFKIQKVCKLIKEINKDIIIFIDNNYGEFVEEIDPIEAGADIFAGSLMKNLGGGIAKTGGYIVGRKDLVFDVSERFSAPGTGKDAGANMNQLRSFYKGLYTAPSVVCSNLKTAIFASKMLEMLGFKVSPKFDEPRADIIQAVELNTPENLVNFCAGIQFGAPIESYARPEPNYMPGYPNDEIMACGSFISGSTTELSCDAPFTPPYTAFLQGGISYEYGKLGIMLALTHLLNKK